MWMHRCPCKPPNPNRNRFIINGCGRGGEMLIGIDGSTVRTGFAFGGIENGSPKGGVWRMPGADEIVFDKTLGGIYESVSILARNVGAEHVCVEAPLLLSDKDHAAHTAMSLIQLTGAIRAAASRAGCKVHLVAVSTVRKHFIGVGNLPGKEAKRRVQERCRQLGWSFEDDNQADANAVWAYGMARFYPKWAPNALASIGQRSA